MVTCPEKSNSGEKGFLLLLSTRCNWSDTVGEVKAAGVLNIQVHFVPNQEVEIHEHMLNLPTSPTRFIPSRIESSAEGNGLARH